MNGFIRFCIKVDFFRNSFSNQDFSKKNCGYCFFPCNLCLAGPLNRKSIHSITLLLFIFNERIWKSRKRIGKNSLSLFLSEENLLLQSQLKIIYCIMYVCILSNFIEESGTSFGVSEEAWKKY